MKKRILAVLTWTALMFMAVVPNPSPAFAASDCQPANRLAISFSSSGDNTVIAADSTRTIYVWQFFIVNKDATTDTNITLKEGSTSITGAYTVKAAGGNHTAPCTGTPWAIPPAGSAFIINSSAAVSVAGGVYYTYSR